MFHYREARLFHKCGNRNKVLTEDQGCMIGWMMALKPKPLSLRTILFSNFSLAVDI